MHIAIVRLTEPVAATNGADKSMLCFFFFLIWFFTHSLNKIRYLLFVWRLVQIGAALYLQDISFTMDVTFWRPEETAEKQN